MALLLLAFSLARLLFLAGFGSLTLLGQESTWQAMGLGLRMDMRLAAMMMFPALVLLRTGGAEMSGWRTWLAPLSLSLALLAGMTLLLVASMETRKAAPFAWAFLILSTLDWALFRRAGLALTSIRRVWAIHALLILGVTLLGYVVDAGSYAYVRTRLSGSLVQFMGNPFISLRMMWETYPVVWLLLLLALVLWAGSRWLRKWVLLTEQPGPGRWMRVVQGMVVFTIALFLIWGRFGGTPLRWGDAYSLGHSFHAKLALNPILFFLETCVDQTGGYDLAEVRATGPLLAKHLGCDYQEVNGQPRLWRTRAVHPRIPKGARPNLVFIHLESLAAHKTGIFGNPLNPTPHFDQLCREGLLFERFYAPAENTSRALFALLFGIADMSPGSRNTATRNPLLVDQRTLINALEGYQRFYFLGGSGDWAQIRATMKHTIQGLQVMEDRAFHSPVVDVWGISDRDLFRETDGYLRQSSQPLFALIQTAGNHPPFTIPPHLGFATEVPSKPALEAASFTGEEEFRALRLMDWSLAQYFANARTSPYFKNTIFVLFGDHGVVRGNQDGRFGSLPLASHHVPLLIYAPGLLESGRITQPCSQMDLMPTLLGLMGVTAENRTLGRDVLDQTLSTDGVAFTFNHFENPTSMGLMMRDHYLVVDPSGEARLHELADPSGQDVSKTHAEIARQSLELTKAYRAWSKYLMNHNKP